MEHVKRCGRQGSDVLHSMGVLSITCVGHVSCAVLPHWFLVVRSKKIHE